NNLLDGISIASPCSADWNQMQGDERRRFCASCKLHVHNLSGMTVDAATALLQQAGGGRVCVRFFRRADGTVLTRDCPVGLRQKLKHAWARAGALWFAMWAAACGRPTAAVEPLPVPSHGVTPMQGAVPLQGEVEMGDVAAPAASGRM
ncbi:MAG: hypothetical protein ABIP94_11310, partial [Planctomycetota bacterium]